MGRLFPRALALLLLAVLCAHAQGPVAPSLPGRIFFVGNSLTEYNTLPTQVLELARAADKWNRYEVKARTVPGAYLHQHVSAVDEALRYGLPWDVVIVQGYSTEPLEGEGVGFRDSVRRLDRVIRLSRSRTVLFMTWAYTAQHGMTKALADAYSSIGTEIGAPVAPVGLAFARVAAQSPTIALRQSDGRHPTVEGTYLAACVIYATLFGRSPEGSTYVARLRAETASTLQKAAWETVVAFRASEAPVAAPRATR